MVKQLLAKPMHCLIIAQAFCSCSKRRISGRPANKTQSSKAQDLFTLSHIFHGAAKQREAAQIVRSAANNFIFVCPCDSESGNDFTPIYTPKRLGAEDAVVFQKYDLH